MAHSAELVSLIQSRVDAFITTRTSILVSIGPELEPLAAFSRQFLSGGKRLRASFCNSGWESVQQHAASSAPPALIAVAAALEIFHAAALVHDDLMDNSDMRRGSPSIHRRFEALHVDNGWVGDARDFGRSSALLLGDLLLGWSDELLDEGLGEADDPIAARSARDQFNRMRTEVTVGQYLDIREEQAWASRSEDDHLDSALRVITYKSAKYSVQAPLVIGACLGGGSSEQIEALRRFGLPLGIAFQLRDDLLGVFGDPLVTGKPSGDDIREGKRTALIAMARHRLSTADRRILDERLGDRNLAPEEIESLQSRILGSGAVDEVEAMIVANVEQAKQALAEAPLEPAALAGLARLTDSATRRTA